MKSDSTEERLKSKEDAFGVEDKCKCAGFRLLQTANSVPFVVLENSDNPLDKQPH